MSTDFQQGAYSGLSTRLTLALHSTATFSLRGVKKHPPERSQCQRCKSASVDSAPALGSTPLTEAVCLAHWQSSLPVLRCDHTSHGKALPRPCSCSSASALPV
ncbi:hypothetical protein UY3_04823 [Chelonia mydas]|uniref:Uncharacterized protein n=1 Tax=Chelonia mydas TaxID=8469 RepID=M7BLG2_CHEMY|nr:hypothetical protein UY3_04823 [Chelonia mydas]